MKDNLGQAVTLVMQAHEELDGFFSDPITVEYGASELGGIVGKAVWEKLKAALAEIGWTIKEVDDELQLRVSAKWAYEAGIFRFSDYAGKEGE